MNIVKIREIERKYQKCNDCSLCLNRKFNPHFGMGHPEGNILVVLPEPYLGAEHPLKTIDLYDNAPIQKNHRLYRPFDFLLRNANISKLDIYCISSIMCPVHEGTRPDKEDILSCRPRLKETVQAFDPSVLVLCGPISYFSWFKEMPTDIKYGVLFDKNNKAIYYTRSIDNFLDLQRSHKYSEEQINLIKNEVLQNWKEIKQLANR